MTFKSLQSTPVYCILIVKSLCISECNATANTTATNDATDETFSITTSTALLTLKAELDYEATREYYLLMTVVDLGISPALTGSIAIRVYH